MTRKVSLERWRNSHSKKSAIQSHQQQCPPSTRDIRLAEPWWPPQNHSQPSGWQLMYANHKIDLRRVSALLLCELLYNNEPLKVELASKLELPLSSGRVHDPSLRCASVEYPMLCRVPQSVSKVLMFSFRVSSSAQKVSFVRYAFTNSDESSAFCWAVSLDRKQCELEFYPFKKYSSFTFLDPQRCLFGITISSSMSSSSIGEFQSPQFDTVKQLANEKPHLSFSAMLETPAK